MTSVRYVGPDELNRLLDLDVDRYDRAAIVADACRINALYMIRRAGSGHLGTSFSSMDLSVWIHLEELRMRSAVPERGVFFSSKGHDVPATYAVLIAAGVLPFDQLHELRRLGGLPGHPDIETPGIITNTGSLGMGISKAKGFAEADRLRGRRRDLFVLTGDGELQEGQIWESLAGAVTRGLGQITVIVDHNKIQSDTWVERVSPLGDIEAKFSAFGWATARCDGHDLRAVATALDALRSDPRPGVLVADTVKGHGVSFMEGIAEGEELYRYHSGAPAFDVVDQAIDELVGRCDECLASVGAPPLVLSSRDVAAPTPVSGVRLVAAYSDALVERMTIDERIVVLDGDLVLDTGGLPVAERFPDRFIECGIAEQDMVSQAGALALEGFVPIVHSFASFLSTRPSEQIFNNATEHTKVVYVGSLAGLVPGGPGHSHQSTRDVSLVSSVPGLLAVEPSHDSQVAPLLARVLDDHVGPAFVRLVTPPIEVPYDVPASAPLIGTGNWLREGNDGVIIGSGPVALAAGYGAAERLNSRWSLGVIDLPYLNRVDRDWLTSVVDGVRLVVIIENHDRVGGQGQFVLAMLATVGVAAHVIHVAVDGVPVSGQNAEVLGHHGLDVDGVVAAIAAAW